MEVIPGDGASAVCNRFIRAGLQFIVLNTVGRTTVRAPKAFDVDEAVLEELRSKTDSVAVCDRWVWRVAIAHNGVLPLHGNRDIVKSEKTLVNFLADRRINIYLHGHGHRFSAHQVKASEVRSIAGMVQVMTPALHTLRLPQDTQRGFSIIKLSATELTREVTVIPFFVNDGVIKQGEADVIDRYVF